MKRIRNLYLPDSDTYFTAALEKDGDFEPGRLSIALQYVTQFRTALDIGAHIGLRSKDLFSKFSCLYSFEPNPETYQCLVANMEMYGNVICMHYALGNESGEVSMMESTTRPGNSGSYFCTHGKGIEIRRLDDFGFRAVDFIKLDVEGFEAEVLKGGEQTIRSCRPVIMLEQKHFRDTEGRIYNDPQAPGTFLQSLGMKPVNRIKNDVVYAW